MGVDIEVSDGGLFRCSRILGKSKSGMSLDKVSIEKLKTIYPDIAERFLKVYEDMLLHHQLVLRVTDGFRSIERQNKLYEIGRTKTKLSPVTNARGGDSLHNYGCAIDICFVGKDPYLDNHPKSDFLWKEFGRIAKIHGFIWGGDFSYLIDRPHIQLTYGVTLPEIRQLYKGGDQKAVWARFDELRKVAST